MIVAVLMTVTALTVLDDANVLAEPPCNTVICTKPAVNGVKIKVALERISSPSHLPVIVEILPPADEPRGDVWLHNNANLRLADCSRNLDENKRECPFAYVMVDSNPRALNTAVGKSNLGIAISMSARSDTECMSNFLKSQLMNAPDRILTIGWRSSLQLAPFALQIALPVLKDLGGPCEPEADYFIPALAFGTVCLTSISIVVAGAWLFVRSSDTAANRPFVPGEFTLEDGAGVHVYKEPVTSSESKDGEQNRDAEKVGELPAGSVDLQVEEISDGWLRISTPQKGWICLEK